MNTKNPLTVGDTVYQTDGVRVYKSQVKRIIYDTDNVAFDDTAIGVSVFLSRIEAERKQDMRCCEHEKQTRARELTYRGIMPEIIQDYCAENPECWHEKEPKCLYADVCFAEYAGPNNGQRAFEKAMLERYMKLHKIDNN
jgi:hypothetical protein